MNPSGSLSRQLAGDPTHACNCRHARAGAVAFSFQMRRDSIPPKGLVTAGLGDRPRSCPFGEHDQQRMRSLSAPRFASVCVNESVGAKRNRYASWLP